MKTGCLTYAQVLISNITKLRLLILLLLATVNMYGDIYCGRVTYKNSHPEKHAVVINFTNKSVDYTDEDGTFCIDASKGDTVGVNVVYYDEIFKESASFFSEFIYDESMNGKDVDYTRGGHLSKPLSRMLSIDIVKHIIMLYSAEKYKECMAYCMLYANSYVLDPILSRNHPYRDRYKERTSWKRPDIEHIVEVCYYGCEACYQYSLINGDPSIGGYGVSWAIACSEIYNDFIQTEIPYDFRSANWMYNYIINGERGMQAAIMGKHFLKAIDPDAKWGKKMNKWYDQKYNDIFKTLYKRVTKMDSYYSAYPLLQYKIHTLSYDNMVRNGKYKDFKELFYQRKEDLIRYIEQVTPNYDLEVYSSLQKLTTLIVETALDRNMQKKIGGDIDRFCMEELIKLQDISYYLNGSSIYSLHPNYTLRDIQNRLNEDECAIISFEGSVMAGLLYVTWDLSSMRRNYQYVITKDTEKPVLWHRGFVSSEKVNSLDKIKEELPNIKKFYYVGTPRMAFIDIAGKDSSIIRLHSLSQLLKDRSTEMQEDDITFIGDLNYNEVGNLTAWADKTKGGNTKYGTLKGPAEELNYLKGLFGTNVKSIIGDNASKKNVLMSLNNKSVVHFSTHGTTSFNPERIFNAADLILKNDVLVNSGLILSGYNDNPDSPSAYLSGADILNLRKLNTSIVFLDACSSGHGKVGVAGSVGMAEAFHLIGVKNIICYLSPIGDKVATQFSNTFYNELSKGKSCHEAFFNAKNSMDQEINVVLWE